jgi:hypothetical protein
VLEGSLQEIELTTGRLLRIVWLLVWRGYFGGAVLGAAAGFVIGFIMAIAGLPTERIKIATGIAGGIAGLAWFVVVCKMALEKQYREFRIALVAPGDDLLSQLNPPRS